MPAETIQWWTMFFTGGAAIAAAVYAGLTYWLMLNAQRGTRASTLVQLVTNNRHLVEYASTDTELMAVVRGDVAGSLTAKQYAYLGLIAGQIMCCFECRKLGALSQELFDGIQLAFVPMLRNSEIQKAALRITESHPDLQNLVKTWSATGAAEAEKK